MGPRVAPRVCAHCRRHRQCWRRVRRCLTLEAGGRARSNGNRYVVPWRVRDVRPLRLRRRAGRPQLKRDPLGCTQKFLIPSRSPTTVVPAGTLARYAGVLLDMNGTFMSGGDRLAPEQAYAATYRALGGRELAAGVVQEAITACFEIMGAIYDDPLRCDSFPQVLDTLRDLPAARDVPETELKLLERVIAEHELGR